MTRRCHPPPHAGIGASGNSAENAMPGPVHGSPENRLATGTKRRRSAGIGHAEAVFPFPRSRTLTQKKCARNTPSGGFLTMLYWQSLTLVEDVGAPVRRRATTGVEFGPEASDTRLQGLRAQAEPVPVCPDRLGPPGGRDVPHQIRGSHRDVTPCLFPASLNSPLLSVCRAAAAHFVHLPMSPRTIATKRRPEVNRPIQHLVYI